MIKNSTLASLALASMLSACASGGGAGSSVAPAISPGATATSPTSTTSTKALVAITIGKHAGSGAAAAARKHRAFVSPSTTGAYVQVFSADGTTQQSATMNDVSPGSANCTANGDGSRTCTIQLDAAPGNVEIEVSLYDSIATANGAPTGDLLGVSPKTPETIVANTSNGPFAIYVGGVITSFNDLPSFASLPADGNAHSLGVIFEPTDFGNNPITAGSNDPYANPITVTLAETGGTGHATLVLNGAASGTTATLTHSSDTLAVSFDGAGTPGYFATLSVAANKVGTSTAPPTKMLQISPLYATASGSSGTTITFTQTSQQSTVTLSEAGAPVNGGETATAQTYYVSATSGCANVATASTPTGTGANSTSTIAATGSGTCTITYSDGMSSIAFTVNSTASSATVTVPGASQSTSNFDQFTTGPVVDYTTTYQSGPLATLNVGQNGWSGNSCGGNPYDANIVGNNAHIPSPHIQALQFSNATFQGCFSGLGSAITSMPAGVPSALLPTVSGASTTCGSTCAPYFAEQFTVSSATGAWQQGLVTSLSPDYANDGARMSYLGLWHTTDPANGNAQRLLVFFVDVEGVTPAQATPCDGCTNFVAYPVAFVDPTVAHTIGLTISFATPSDSVAVYVDGTKYTTGADGKALGTRSWQDYYQLDTESDPNGANPYSRGVDSLYFRAGNLDGCTADTNATTGYFGPNGCGAGSNPSEAAALKGNGYLFTDVDLCAGTAATCAGTVTGASEARRSGSAVSARTRATAGLRLAKRSVRAL